MSPLVEVVSTVTGLQRSDAVEVVSIETGLSERIEQVAPEQKANKKHDNNAASLWVGICHDLVEVGEAHVVAE